MKKTFRPEDWMPEVPMRHTRQQPGISEPPD